MKQFVLNTLIMVIIAGWVAGNIFLFTRALITPIQIDPYDPQYSTIAIVEWAGYICITVAGFVTAITR